MDEQSFRTAMSHWATGVSVITAPGLDGQPCGFTASSFSSLSLHPPMVLFCLGQGSSHIDAFRAAEGFVVNVLEARQQELSLRFAQRGGDKFEGIPFQRSSHGAPILQGCLATLECRRAGIYPGGDHLIFLGEVEAVQHNTGVASVALPWGLSHPVRGKLRGAPPVLAFMDRA